MYISEEEGCVDCEEDCQPTKSDLFANVLYSNYLDDNYNNL